MNKLEIKILQRILERFGQPVGALPPGPMVGVRDERHLMEDEPCECSNESTDEPCAECQLEACLDEGKKSKKSAAKNAAKSFVKGTKTFKEKVKKASSWAKDPAAYAAWATKQATGKWPSQE